MHQKGAVRTSNLEPIVEQRPDAFQHLLAYVTGPDARSQTAYAVESTVFRRLLALGAALLRLCCVTQAAVRPAEPVTAPDRFYHVADPHGHYCLMSATPRPMSHSTKPNS
jgi:hypothetical protein